MLFVDECDLILSEVAERLEPQPVVVPLDNLEAIEDFGNLLVVVRALEYEQIALS